MARARMSHTVDRAAVRRVATGPEIVAELVTLRGRVAREARRLTPDPWMPDGPGSPIVEGPVGVSAGKVSTSYGSTDFAAHLIEFGSSKTPPLRPLHRAAQALGLKVTDSR